MEKPYSLEACRSYCNDGQIYPAMAYKVDTEGKPKKQAGREVEDETDGAVTAGRALQVPFLNLERKTNGKNSD